MDCELLTELRDLFARIDGVPAAVKKAASAAGPRSRRSRGVAT
jgi:hypothetical protein